VSSTTARKLALNASPQLGLAISMAPPVHFAHKMCKRMYDYIYHYRFGDANDLPDIMHKAFYHKSNHADQNGSFTESLTQNDVSGVVCDYRFDRGQKQKDV
jgi:hypothetical protein